MPLQIPVSIQIDQAIFNAAILNALVDRLTKTFGPDYKAAVKARMAVEAPRLIRASAEYASLHGGVLQGELGVANPTQAMEEIFVGLVNAIDVNVDGPRLTGQTIAGSVTASILRSDLADVLRSPGASFLSGQHTVEWLRWLLTEGNRRDVVADYAFLGNSPTRGARVGSRTGLGVMRKSKTGGWGVPTQFAGTLRDNWFIRVLKPMERFIGDILVDELRKRF